MKRFVLLLPLMLAATSTYGATRASCREEIGLDGRPKFIIRILKGHRVKARQKRRHTEVLAPVDNVRGGKCTKGKAKGNPAAYFNRLKEKNDVAGFKRGKGDKRCLPEGISKAIVQFHNEYPEMSHNKVANVLDQVGINIWPNTVRRILKRHAPHAPSEKLRVPVVGVPQSPSPAKMPMARRVRSEDSWIEELSDDLDVLMQATGVPSKDVKAMLSKKLGNVDRAFPDASAGAFVPMDDGDFSPVAGSVDASLTADEEAALVDVILRDNPVGSVSPLPTVQVLSEAELKALDASLNAMDQGKVTYDLDDLIQAALADEDDGTAKLPSKAAPVAAVSGVSGDEEEALDDFIDGINAAIDLDNLDDI